MDNNLLELCNKMKEEISNTACGKQGGYFELYLNPWDYAAGMLLIQEAGGKVTNWNGNVLDPD